jgi:hypothetical protein
MSDNGIKVILTNKSMSNIGKPAEIKLGPWTEEQKQYLLNFVKNYNPNDFADTKCFCNVHFGNMIIHANGIQPAKQFTPIRPRNKKNEMIIEIIPAADANDRYCGLKMDANCALCFQRDLCKSQFIKHICEILSVNRHAAGK